MDEACVDPHTAVGVLGLREARKAVGEDVPGIVLSTAHPVKFREHVEPILGREIEVPLRLAACLQRPSRAEPLANDVRALKELLLGWKGGVEEAG